MAASLLKSLVLPLFRLNAERPTVEMSLRASLIRVHAYASFVAPQELLIISTFSFKDLNLRRNVDQVK